MIRYPQPLVEGVVLRRYKRFLADVQLPGGEVVVAHCPNPGSMKASLEQGGACRISPASNPARKLRWTLEQTRVAGCWVMVHTGWSNHVVAAGIRAGGVPELAGYPELQREKRYGSRNSRIDLLLCDGERRAYVEVKNVTLAEGTVAAFPDAVTERGTKHLHELIEVVAEGQRGVLFFHVGRGDVDRVRPADEIDPVYGRTLRQAAAAGVEILAYRCEVGAEGLGLGRRLPVDL